MTLRFPPDFLWGVATSAYQIEGAVDVDGRCPSIWDEFCARPGAICDGSSGAIAVDHYHRVEEDLDAIARLGLTAYRFSVAWPRIVGPDGRPNAAGLDFYSRLVDGLLARGIRPWVTLYHWDLPQHLDGGWTERATAERFAEYAAVTHRVLGDRVRTWTTLNEPWCSAFLGYGSGEHAPGRHDPSAAFAAAHHLLLGHGMATQALRAEGAAEIGITLNFSPVQPADPARAADVDLARRVDGLSNRFFVDALFRGSYPVDVLDDAGALWPEGLVRGGDLDVVATPMDILGVNYYTTWRVTSAAGGPAHAAAGSGSAGTGTGTLPHPTAHLTAPEAVPASRGLPRTSMGWDVDPDGLHELLAWLQREYTGPAGIPLYVTENGAAFADGTLQGDVVQDDDRIDYLRGHLAAAHRAIGDGVDLRGYFAWSLVDNFEWAHGYSKKFGLLWVDEDLRRHPKLSAQWFSRVAREGCV